MLIEIALSNRSIDWMRANSSAFLVGFVIMARIYMMQLKVINGKESPCQQGDGLFL
jgi:hypothetical protein